MVKTSELTGAALDWAVAKCEGVTVLPRMRGGCYVTLAKGETVLLNYSTDWAQGGPIIERECILLTPNQGTTYLNCVWFAGSANEDGDEFNGEGSTPLIAAMRCFVASKLGDEVEVPDELLEFA